MIFIKTFFLTLFILLAPFAKAEINNNRPPFSLTLSQVEQWSPSSTLADANNISTIPLQSRLIADLGNTETPLDPQVKVLIAPDGMNNFANYIEEQKKFNLYNFTHWSHIDVLNWFAGTANETVNLPAKPWVDTAHRNGVKVIGTVYLSVVQYGGNVETVARLLQQNAQGEFPFAKKLVALAQYYQFDGWLINPETNLTYVKNEQGEVIQGKFEYKNAALLGKKMQAFMRYLTQIAPDAMEIHWYDSTLLDGSVKWQNELNAKNAPFLQDKQQRISDAMFMNYWWNGDMVQASHDYVHSLGRSHYDLYFGADLSPERNAQRIFERGQWLKALFPKKDDQAISSIALFGNDVNYTFTGNEHTTAFSDFRKDNNDYQRFYDTETRLFAGDDLNIYTADESEKWPGIARYVPAKTTLTALPFSTNFNTGHGLKKFYKGEKVSGEWHNIAQQDILPTWQFAIEGNQQTSVYYDFNTAYTGGNSLAIRSEKSSETNQIPLYQSQFLLKGSNKLDITYQSYSSSNSLALWLDIEGKRIYFPLANHLTEKNKQWFTATFDLSIYAAKSIERIGIIIDIHPHHDIVVNIGQLDIR